MFTSLLIGTFLSISSSATVDTQLVGDINSDGTVDIYDAILLARSFNCRSGDPNWGPSADINVDNVVDIYDAILLATNYGKPRIEFQTIVKGYYSGHTSSAYYVIDNQENWTNVWNEYQRIFTPQYPPPEVNFSESLVIAVFMGEQTSGGFEIAIKSIHPRNNLLVVNVDKTHPGPHCIVTLALTQPYHIIKLDKIDKQIVFETTETVRDCI
jgi:hypothetical protein